MRYRAGDRAVSAIVGAIMVLVIVLVLATMYQVYGVPAETREIEFQHSQAARGDLLEVRNAVLEAKRSGQATTAAVDLAPQYPTRLFSLNPPPASGTLRTTENGTVEVLRLGTTPVDVCPVSPETRMLEYDAAYNAYEEGPTIRVENTVAYADYGDAVRPFSGQQLVSGDRVDLVLVQNSYRESGDGVASVEPRPGQIEERRVNDPTVRVPTALPEADWEAYLDGEVDPSRITVTGGVLELDLEGVHTVSCGVVGARGTPPGGPRPAPQPPDINPAGPGTLEFVGGEILPTGGGPPGGGPPGGGPPGGGGPGGGGNSRDVRLTFNNSGTDQVNVTAARIAFYYQSPTPSRSDITEADVYDAASPTANYRGTLVILDPTFQLTQPIVFPGSAETAISLRFDVRPDQSDFFVLQLTFDDGEQGTYFIGME